MVAFPVVPVHPVAKAFMLAAQVEAVQVGVVAGGVPPGAGEPEGAVVAPRVVVTINGTEFRTSGWKTSAQV